MASTWRASRWLGILIHQSGLLETLFFHALHQSLAVNCELAVAVILGFRESLNELGSGTDDVAMWLCRAAMKAHDGWCGVFAELHVEVYE